MSKKFTERSKLNLSEVNKEVLQQWDDEDVFHLSMSEREGCPSFAEDYSALTSNCSSQSPQIK